jgi:hypothetical protein
VDAQIVQEHQGDASAGLRARHGAAQLRTQRRCPTARRPFPIEPTIPPVDQAKAVLLLVVPRRFDQPLPTAAPGTPDASQRWMQSDLHFVLQIHVSPWQQPQQPGQILWHLISKQQRIRQQIINRWRHGRCRGR